MTTRNGNTQRLPAASNAGKGWIGAVLSWLGKPDKPGKRMTRTVKSNWTSLHSSIVRSSLMEAPITARYVFLMFLSQSDEMGFVQGTTPSLAREFNIRIEEFRKCVEILESPDPRFKVAGT
jgi:hypothetical protein